MVSRQHMASLVDQRGYIFTLPSLGLPDPAGEWVTIKGAIGVKQQALPLILDETTDIKPSLRSPSAEAKILDFEFQGALWLLPLVTPRGNLNSPLELFTVRVQRLLPSPAPDSSRMKLPDNHKWICLTPAEGMTAYVASLASPVPSPAVQPQAPRFSFSSTRSAASGSTTASPRPTRPHHSTVLECSEVDGNHSGEWRALALKTLDEDWVGSVFYQNMAESIKDGRPHDPEGMTIVLREHPAFNNEIRSLDYAIVRVGEHEDDDFEEERWKTLPPQAFKPGAERKLVNSARRSMGKRPLTEDEWASRPAAAL